MNRRVHGLYAVTPDDPDTERLQRRVVQALRGGARLVQYRGKSGPADLRKRQAEALLGVCRAAGAPLIINDDLELALAVDADGLHLGRDDGDLSAARRALGSGKLLGASCYGELTGALNAAELGADYVAFGSAFPSSTKPGAGRASLSLFRDAKARIGLPVVAIGGITPDNARALVGAGVDALAVISALFDAPDIEARAHRFALLFPGEAATTPERPGRERESG